MSSVKHSASVFYPCRSVNASLITLSTVILKIPSELDLPSLKRLRSCLGHRNRLRCMFFFHSSSASDVLNASYSQDFQFFPAGLAQLQERELAVFKVFFHLFSQTTT